ncbi:MAG: hypothetical protein K2H14_08440 [Muribaculaceae bacterium]|nr:hypothetical protein [Muribaculaceae bacterium]
MSFFRYFRHAFGFGDSAYDDEELEGIDARVTPLRERKDQPLLAEGCHNGGTQADDAAQPDQALPEVAAEGDECGGHAVPHDIFDSVVKVFNEALPEFLQQTVDGKAQKDYLFELLEASTKDYLAKAEAHARRRMEAVWENDRRRLMKEMDDLKMRADKEEEGNSEAKKQKLSAERQKRALSERVHELEKQLANIEAENEQYILENKSLVNKIRLSNVLAADGIGNVEGDVAEKMLELTAEAETLRKTVEEREAECAGAISSRDEALAECESLNAEITKLNEAIEQSKAKDDLSDAMLTELNRKTSEAVEAAKKHKAIAVELEAEVTTLRQQLAEAKENAESLSAENGNLKGECGALAEKLRESMESLEVVEEMSRQLDELEKARQTNESFLRKQKDELMRQAEELRQAQLENKEYEETLRSKEETIRRLEDLTDSLRKTIENNLYEHAQSESALRSEIERLKEKRPRERGGVAASQMQSEPTLDLESGNDSFEVNLPEKEKPKKAETAARKRKSKKGGVRISAIDETLEDTDWLLATPPAGSNEPKGESNEFGYKEPARRQAPENPAQMSLW